MCCFQGFHEPRRCTGSSGELVSCAARDVSAGEAELGRGGDFRLLACERFGLGSSCTAAKCWKMTGFGLYSTSHGLMPIRVSSVTLYVSTGEAKLGRVCDLRLLACERFGLGSSCTLAKCWKETGFGQYSTSHGLMPIRVSSVTRIGCDVTPATYLL